MWKVGLCGAIALTLPAIGCTSILGDFPSGDASADHAAPLRDAAADNEMGKDADSSVKDSGKDSGTDTLADAPAAPAPRPTAPLSTSFVTSRRPTLHWVLPSGVPDATVDICHDRACKTLIVSEHVTGTSYVPKADLPTGVVYWRLHPLKMTGVTSSTWQFTVGALTAPIDTSWGTTLDVNGDGFADFAVGASGVLPCTDYGCTGEAYLYMGSSSGLALTPISLISPTDSAGYFGEPVASAGDVNGDGYADLVVGAPGSAGGTGSVYIYLGGPSGITLTPIALSGPGGVDGYFGVSVVSAGDVNGDGYADLVVGATGTLSNTGNAYVYLGGVDGLATSPAATLTGPAGTGGDFGYTVASLDVNGDGFGDIVVGANDVSSAQGSVYYYPGSSSGIANGASPTATLIGPAAGGDFASSLSSAGDVNGDGYGDLIVGAPVANAYVGAAYVYFGSMTGFMITPTTLAGLGVGGTESGNCVAGVGDVNGDGYADVAVGGPGGGGSGNMYVYLGKFGGLNLTPATLPGVAMSGFGISCAAAGDVNGDGYADLGVGGPSTATNTGSVYVYSGSKMGLKTTGITTLNGPDGMNGYFGNFLFGASE
jgi:hypothetical protein